MIEMLIISQNQDMKNPLVQSVQQLHKLDENALSVDSSEKFYILGLFAAGHISKNKSSKYIDISLHKNDKMLLEDLKKFFKTEKPIYESTSDQNCHLTLFSDVLYDIFNEYGIHPRKSKTLKLNKNIPSRFIPDFLRGVFDGNGSITKSKTRSIHLATTASKKFATQLEEMYSQINCTVKAYKTVSRKSISYVVSSGWKDGLKILKKLYSPKSIFMPRKYEIFINHSRPIIDEIMMETAFTISSRSTCIRAKVGCIITNSDKTNIVSYGYNGQVKGFPNHCNSVYAGECGCLHAEENALLKNSSGTVLYCTTMPCIKCAKLICQTHIEKVYFGQAYRDTCARQIFRKAGIINKIIPRDSYLWKLENIVGDL